MENQPEPIKEKTWRELFNIGIGLKGVKAVVEILLGSALFFVSKNVLTGFFSKIISSDLIEDINTKFPARLAASLLHFTNGTKVFAAWYIIFHGATSLFIVVSLFLKKLWAYLVMMAFTIIFIFYQLYKIIFSHVYILGIITFFDLLLLVLTWHEYQYNKAKLKH